MKWAQKQKGFTIVELLIVVVVIAILAAITIVAYNGIQNRAKMSAAQSLVSQANKKILAYAVLNGDQYPTSLTAAGISNTEGLQYSYDNNASPKTYGITATNGPFSYYVSSTTSQPTEGGYSGHGRGGVAAITNLAVNPSIEVDTYGLTPSLNSLSRDTSWSSQGSSSVKVTPTSTTGTDNFVNLDGDQNGGFRTGLQAGKTYTVSASLRMTAPMTGTVRAQARMILAFYTNENGSHSSVQSQQAPNAAGVTRLSVTFSIPSNAIGAWIRLYSGTQVNGGDVWWDGIMVTEGANSYTFADGTNTNWAWNGTPHASTSSGTPL
jgi:prepilin-type N-terminal cleavage/methylation domain-containing protein